MRIIIAPDKFKGSLSAPDVAAHLEIGLRSVLCGLEVERIPVADGGEGTLDAAVGSGYTRKTVTATGPTGRPLAADFAVRGTEAVIEMATASGLAVLPGGRADALGATSRGTGELIRAALDAGCTDIVLGVGGSACTDGGAGLLAGLGARMLDGVGRELPGGGGALARIETVDFARLDPRLTTARFILASDVDNPLLGPNGAAEIFGPQKGASPDDVRALEHGLECFFRILANELGSAAVEAENAAGAGAAGGVGYAALAVLNALRRPGIDVVLGFTALEDRIRGADLVITGEGSLDEQSLGGKTPMGVARAAARAGVPVIAVCGRTTLDPGSLLHAGFARTYTLTQLEPDISSCMADAGNLLVQLGAKMGTELDECALPHSMTRYGNHQPSQGAAHA
ncbi:glycerate kinase [Paenarthrobacter sp. Z7-10]|uniref:glycerate kinase n=1 Tax=Paenarthrobacter sp. Z7-10 TaxID=2787635 RepID=UPI0022A9F017|nr:glycerate kinase [Paenarthrobacter sp. Z7-10]MCZ2403836.1 glycerate kinase [Paenarthrobacter sp. Z7-10]